MQKHEFTAFCSLLDDAFELISGTEHKTLSGNAKAMFFAAFEHYSLSTIQAALHAHCLDPVRGRFLPKPADLIAQIDALAAKDGRPSVEEAWALALRGHDENETVIWTSEMAQAFSLCQPVLQRSDEVGARMAFKEAYQRLVSAARTKEQAPIWWVSLGWDASKRSHAVAHATQLGLLTNDIASRCLLPQDVGSDTDATNKCVGWATSEQITQLDFIRECLAQGDAIRASKNAHRVAAEQACTLAQKRQTQAAVEQFELCRTQQK